MKEAMNFRALAKNVITLPKHPNIVDVLGVSLEDVPYLIYLEYIDYGTLKDFLMRNYQQSSSGSSNKDDVRDYDKTLQLTTFAFDICQGMLFLDKQSYRHPALSARKALLSSRGQCKLYDFWPVDVANDAVNQLLEQKIPPIAWLPPETVFIGQYSEKSDIWSFGVVVWEIFSLGETPFGGLTCAEIEGKLRRKQYLEQPRACAGGIFGTMLSMWNPSVNERPSFSSLYKTLQAFLNDMKKNINERCEEEPNYFSLDKDSSDDDYIEHV
ncbi:hypothetical protein BSL78_13595 [Apostichopus japonicus]|uniref:Protein kinase domain-containing protein n=1 Tax=Stichopus japonicus TaxID=307972 RepID=A0A2G8KNJ9_STIJA|nr:hypothetical protein BSL78_13595 [Apostichopus japonicus]